MLKEREKKIIIFVIIMIAIIHIKMVLFIIRILLY